MKQIISNIQHDLRKNIDAAYEERGRRFYKEKEKVEAYGVRTAMVRRIARKYFIEIKHLDKREIFSLCEELLKSGYNEEATIAFDWAFRMREQYQKEDFKIFESWLKKYVSNWGECDDFCTHAFGDFMLNFPEFLPRIRVWTKSSNRWLRRASAVILIYPIERRHYFNDVFKIANLLLLDKDDLVQKGYGWTLKQVSNLYPKRVFNYVMRNKTRMPRTALRYAIEKLPDKLRKKAMERQS